MKKLTAAEVGTFLHIVIDLKGYHAARRLMETMSDLRMRRVLVLEGQIRDGELTHTCLTDQQILLVDQLILIHPVTGERWMVKDRWERKRRLPYVLDRGDRS